MHYLLHVYMLIRASSYIPYLWSHQFTSFHTHTFLKYSRAVDVKSNEAYGAVSIQEIKSNEAYDICHQEQPNDNYQMVQPPIIPPPPSGNLSPSVVCQCDEDASYAMVSVEQEPFDEPYEEVGPNEEHLYETVEVPQSPNEYDEPRFENVHTNT